MLYLCLLEVEKLRQASTLIKPGPGTGSENMDHQTMQAFETSLYPIKVLQDIPARYITLVYLPARYITLTSMVTCEYCIAVSLLDHSTCSGPPLSYTTTSLTTQWFFKVVPPLTQSGAFLKAMASARKYTKRSSADWSNSENDFQGSGGSLGSERWHKNMGRKKKTKKHSPKSVQAV